MYRRHRQGGIEWEKETLTGHRILARLEEEVVVEETTTITITTA